MLVLSGPQANGKSTIAKAIFFFRTMKEDIDYCTQKYLKIGKYLQKKV